MQISHISVMQNIYTTLGSSLKIKSTINVLNDALLIVCLE
jgi:hypothetical protein